jgi:hypothetical protein
MYWLTKLFVVNLNMNHKLLYIFSFLLLFISCKKEQESNLSLQHIKISGAGTTYYSNQDYNLLLQLTDTSKIYTISELKYSMNNIAFILTKYKDRAGAFPTLYNVVTNVAYETLNNMHTDYAAMGKAFMNEFGKHYIRNFHNYLTGNEIEPAWLNYYRRVAENKNTILHLAMSGINAHITYDIPFVLDNINAVQEFYPDFEVYTDFIAATYPEVALEMKNQYGVQNAANVFKLFQLGDLIDGLNGNGYTTHIVIDVLRSQSWQRGMKIENGNRTIQQMHQECFYDFSVRENLIQAFDNAKLLN